MPKPSCSRPSQRLRQIMANTSAAPWTSGRSSSDTRPRNRTGAPRRSARRSSRARSRPLPAMASTRSGSGRGEPADGVDQPVEALAGHQPAEPEHDRRAPGSRPNRWRVGGPLLGVERVEPVGCRRPGGTTTVGTAACAPAARAASAAG